MVVVNDAEELVGQTDVAVVVLSTRPTNQGCSSSPASLTKRVRSVVRAGKPQEICRASGTFLAILEPFLGLFELSSK